MAYTRANPSQRYLDLQKQYRTLHEEGEKFLGLPPEKTFPGASLPAQAPRIKRLIDLTGAQVILDYGSGKGQQYEPVTITDGSGNSWPSVMEYWDVDEIVCYDPCYVPFSALPEGRFDGVISTDVLEHCPEEDIEWIIGEIFDYAGKFVFANVACYPAKKRLPTGENAHCTIKPVEWWREIFERAAGARPELKWEIWIQWKTGDGADARVVEEKIGNA